MNIERRSLILDEIETDSPLLAVAARSEECSDTSQELIVG